MKKTLAIFLFVLATSAYSEDRAMNLSSYNPALKMDSIDESESIAKFSGKITITGEIFFIFDGDDQRHAVDINFAHFVPDDESRGQLPSVVAGFYPGVIRHISLEPANSALEFVYGKEMAEQLKHGSELVVSTPVQVELRNFIVSIECDSRAYWTTSFSLKPMPKQSDSAKSEVSSGC